MAWGEREIDAEKNRMEDIIERTFCAEKNVIEDNWTFKCFSYTSAWFFITYITENYYFPPHLKNSKSLRKGLSEFQSRWVLGLRLKVLRSYRRSPCKKYFTGSGSQSKNSGELKFPRWDSYTAVIHTIWLVIVKQVCTVNKVTNLLAGPLIVKSFWLRLKESPCLSSDDDITDWPW